MRVGRFLASSRSSIAHTPCHPQGFSRPSRWEAIVGALHGCAEPSLKAASCEFGEGDWWSRAAFPVSTTTRPLRCNTLLRDAASALAQLRVSSLPTTASTASAGCTSQPPGRDEYVSVGVIEHREMFLYLEAMSDVNAQTKLREVLWPPASRLHRQIQVKARHALRSAVEEIQSCGLCGPSQESIRKGLGMTEAHMLDELFSLSDNLPASRVTAPMQTTGLPVTKEVSVEHAFCFTSRMAPHWSRACSLRRGATGVSRECDGVHRTPSVSKRCYDVLWEHFEFLLADMVELRILIANAVELEVILAEASYLRRSFHHQPLSADSPEAHEQLRRMCSLVLRSALWGRQGLDQLHVAAAVARFRECCSFVCPEDAASPNHLCTSVQRLYQAVRLHLRHTWDEPSSETPANTLPQGQPSRIAQRKKIKRKKSDHADNSLMAALLMGSKQ